MIIVAGYTRTDVHKRDASVQAFAAMVERARQQDGCVDLSISADSVDPERVNLFECWRDEQAWNAWRKIAKGPRTRPREICVTLYRGAKVEKTFRSGGGKRRARVPRTGPQRGGARGTSAAKDRRDGRQR
jgi:quinol monooxygenase YgiN